MINLMELSTFLYLTFWAVFSTKQLIRGKRSSINFVMCVFYVFFGIPLILDIIIGKPEYVTRPGFYLASRDEMTSLIYCLYLLFIPIIWWLTSKRASIKRSGFNLILNENSKSIKLLRKCLPLIYLIIILPLIAVILSPEPKIYLNYAATALHLLKDESRDFHRIVELTTVLSVFASAVVLFLSKQKKIIINLIVLLPFLSLAIWINGKRYILLYTVVLVLYILWTKKILVGSRLVITVLVSLFIFSSFSMGYQNNIRFQGNNAISNTDIYENIRLDYGRDDVTKLIIFAELNPDKVKILEHRGQSIIFYLSMYIPREWWSEKPLPYAKYVTSAMFLVEPRMWSWGMTTSILEEAIANFSWFGVIIGPLIVSLVCRIGDSFNDPLINLFTMFNSILLLVVHLPAFAPFFLLWVALILRKYISNRIRL